jgi:hypothetical protein
MASCAKPKRGSRVNEPSRPFIAEKDRSPTEAGATPFGSASGVSIAAKSLRCMSLEVARSRRLRQRNKLGSFLGYADRGGNLLRGAAPVTLSGNSRQPQEPSVVLLRPPSGNPCRRRVLFAQLHAQVPKAALRAHAYVQRCPADKTGPRGVEQPKRRMP